MIRDGGDRWQCQTTWRACGRCFVFVPTENEALLTAKRTRKGKKFLEINDAVFYFMFPFQMQINLCNLHAYSPCLLKYVCQLNPLLSYCR
jgi:hypothetical protein